MNKTEPSEIYQKQQRVLAFLEQNGYDGLIIGRKDNFAWFTCGGANEVVIPSEAGFALLLINSKTVRLIAQIMDGQRIIDEELGGLEVDYVPLHWYEPSREAKAAELIRGMRVVSDVPVEGARYEPKALQDLHFPLLDVEIERLRWLGKTSEQVLRRVADEVRPGLREQEIAGMLLGEYGRLGIQCDVLLVGSDERIFKYRHPYPTEKAVERYILLHPAVSKWGLHANVTRLLHFGEPPEEIQGKYRVACQIETAAISMCVPGGKFRDILEEQKMLYGRLGFPEEWRYHFQGGITGYILADPTLAMDPQAEVSANQAYDWFITITGVKAEELSLNTGDQREICSVTGAWPTRTFEYSEQVFNLPEIMLR